MSIGWERRFFSGTRGRVVELLRRGRRTVEDLAQALGLTDNAVRAHLVALERDGLVRQGGLRRGASRPAYAYELTPEAERLFPKPYDAALTALVGVLDERLPADAVEAALRETGRRLAAGRPTPTGDPEERVARAVAALGELGGLAEWETSDDRAVIRGFSCPLAVAAAAHPGVCLLAESLLAELTGLPVAARCDRAEGAHCRFEIALRP